MIVAIKRNDGGISILRLIEGDIQTEINKWQESFPEARAVSWREIKEELPDRYFRDAWIDEGTIDVDANKALEIHKNNLRTLRKPLLEKLDIEYQKADETLDIEKKADIAAQKQALRDVTNQEFPTDLTALKNFIPTILKGEE